MNNKYVALWIPSGEEPEIGKIFIDYFNNPYQLVKSKDGLQLEDNSTSYAFPDARFVPAKLYLCDKNLTVGKRCFNSETRECFVIPNEFYIMGSNRNFEDHNVVGAIDPNLMLRNGTQISENNIDGFMFGGGDDQLGFFSINTERIQKECIIELNPNSKVHIYIRFDAEYLQSKGWVILSDEQGYIKASKYNGKLLLSYNSDGGWLGIKEDGGTRTVFNGALTRISTRIKDFEHLIEFVDFNY